MNKRRNGRVSSAKRTTEQRVARAGEPEVIDFSTFTVLPKERSVSYQSEMRSSVRSNERGASQSRIRANAAAQAARSSREDYAYGRTSQRNGYASGRAAGTSRREQDLQRGGAWVDGNTVRKAAPKSRPQKQKSRRQMNRWHINNRKMGRHISAWERQPSFVYMAAIAVCAAIALFSCVHYLHLQAENTKSVKNIYALERQLTELRQENDDNYNRLNGNVDLDEIRDIAINELGMVYATTDQVVLYNGDTNDFVRQYAEVPQEEQTTLSTILATASR